MTDSLGIPEAIRKTIVRELEEQGPQCSRSRQLQSSALLSTDEAEQLNAAVDTVADKLGFSGELETIDGFLRLRNRRVVRILSAARLVEDPVL